MKKNFFAALAAAAMLCCTLAAPVSAAETYQMGDVNMDGEVDVDDAILILQDYVEVICMHDGILTKGQKLLGNVDGRIFVEELPDQSRIEYIIDVSDALYILKYYVASISGSAATLADVIGKAPEYTPEIDAFFEAYAVSFDTESRCYIATERNGT